MSVICSVFDSKADAYLEPFFSVNTATALRAFESAVQKEGHNFNTWAEDYTLFELAEFDEQTGKITPHATPKSIVQAHSLKAKMEAL